MLNVFLFSFCLVRLYTQKALGSAPCVKMSTGHHCVSNLTIAVADTVAGQYIINTVVTKIKEDPVHVRTL